MPWAAEAIRRQGLAEEAYYESVGCPRYALPPGEQPMFRRAAGRLSLKLRSRCRTIDVRCCVRAAIPGLALASFEPSPAEFDKQTSRTANVGLIS